MKTIGLASDHAGFELKQYVKKWLEATKKCLPEMRA
jgi:ribose 5-phosphate isomerase B